MKDAVIVSAVRTAVGKAPKGTLRTTRPDEMGAAVIKEAAARVPGLELSAIEDVIMASLISRRPDRSMTVIVPPCARCASTSLGFRRHSRTS